MYNTAILLFNGVEVLDFAGPFEVFSVTSELNDYKLFNVFTITRDGLGVKTINNLKVLPDYSIKDHPPIDILIIPGGAGTRVLIQDQAVLNWVEDMHADTTITLSVCSGALVLGKLGLLDNLECITHHEVIPVLEEIAPAAVVKPEKRFIDNGKIMTSAGISAGIDLSLYLVEKLYGADVKRKTVEYMEYGNWRE